MTSYAAMPSSHHHKMGNSTLYGWYRCTRIMFSILNILPLKYSLKKNSQTESNYFYFEGKLLAEKVSSRLLTLVKKSNEVFFILHVEQIIAIVTLIKLLYVCLFICGIDLSYELKILYNNFLKNLKNQNTKRIKLWHRKVVCYPIESRFRHLNIDSETRVVVVALVNFVMMGNHECPHLSIR